MITLTAEQAQQIEEALMKIADLRNLGKIQPEVIAFETLYTIRAARAQEQEPYTPYGFCPICGRAGVSRERGLNGSDTCVTGHRYASSEAIPDTPQPVKQEPMMDYERINALREGEQNGAEDAYFFVRPENDRPTLRKMFCQGFERGFHKGLKYAAPVRTKDLTDDEIMKINVDTAGIVPTCDRQFHFARAVIAADREKNRG